MGHCLATCTKSATESLSERMGGLELQLTQGQPGAEEGEAAPVVTTTTPGPGSVAEGSVSQHHGDERTCSEASWGRGNLHPVRDVSIEGSDAISCAGSQLERDTCSHVTPERIKCQVHRELAALQSQINKSLEVLAALARSSDLLSVLKEYPISEKQPDTVSAISGMDEQRDDDKENILQTSGMGEHQLAKSCPALASQMSTATQTEEEQPCEQIDQHPRMAGSTGDVKEFDEPSPKRFRSSSFVAAILGSNENHASSETTENVFDDEEDEQLTVQVIDTLQDIEFETSRESPDDFRVIRKLSVLHEEVDEGTVESRHYTTISDEGSVESRHYTLAPPPYRAPPNPYQSRSFESYLDPEPGVFYPDTNRLCPQGSIKRQVSDPTPTGEPDPPPYREPPAPGERLVLVAQVHREENGLQCGPRSTSRPLQLPPTTPSPPPARAVHFDATSPQSPPYTTPPDASPWTSPRASACMEEPPPLISARASALRASLRRRSCRVIEEHQVSTDNVPPVSETAQQHEGTSSEEASSPGSERPSSLHPRLRQRGSITGVSSVIQRAAAVDLDESDETGPAMQEGCGAQTSSAGAGDKRVSLAFPNLPEAVLRQMGLHREGATSPESLTEYDIENKFTRLTLAFKTDKLTLEHRVGIQQRQRDDAEKNVAREVSELRAKLNRLQRLCQESETIEELSEVQHQVDILAQSTESVSRAAEMYGAVQQEDRVSRAVDVILAHVENLKRIQSKEHTELEEARRLLQEAPIEPSDELTPSRGSRLKSQQLQSVQPPRRVVIEEK